MTYNQPQVKKSLKVLVELFNKNKIKYKAFGSIIPATLNGKPHRKINDFDFLTDIAKTDLLLKELKKLGYQSKSKRIWRFSEQMGLYIYKHPKLLEISFFTVKFGKTKTILKARSFRFVVANKAIKDTEYNFAGVKFNGIPKGTAYTGALIAKWNPKRKEEFKIFKSQKVKPRLNNYIDVYLGKYKIDWSLDLLNFLLNVLGIIRVKFGLAYDFSR